jgi:DUF1680 family protein
VTIRVDAAPEAARALKLRVPGWAAGASLRLNGQTCAPPEPGHYAELHRGWSEGDVVELTLPMRPRLLQAHPLVEEARNQVAVQRGPLIYCVESVDLPPGVRVADVEIPRSIELTARSEPGLLGDVTVLEGRAAARPSAAWAKQLYRELSPAPPGTIDLRLIPYYAWGNRGRSEMTVWMPLGSDGA